MKRALRTFESNVRLVIFYSPGIVSALIKASCLLARPLHKSRLLPLQSCGKLVRYTARGYCVLTLAPVQAGADMNKETTGGKFCVFDHGHHEGRMREIGCIRGHLLMLRDNGLAALAFLLYCRRNGY
jgi:hypothetical protein